MQSYIARVSEHTILATTFHYLHLELIKPDLIDFQAGQYVSLLIDKNSGLRRSYSIASVPSTNHAIDLLVNIAPQGQGSKYIENLKPGDTVEFLGPIGNLIVDSRLTINDPSADEAGSRLTLAFVATGCGIAPIRSMILDQLVDKRNPNPVCLWWGMRYEEDCFWEEDFDLLEKEHSNFKWDLVLSHPPEDWPLHQGHVTSYVIDYLNNARHPEQSPVQRGVVEGSSVSDINNLQLYICSDQRIVDEISTKLIEAGIKNEQIHFEKFGSSS